MNLVALLTCVLCGVGAYVLARAVGLSAAAGVVAGIVFAFDPARFFRMSQLHLTAVQWVPFGLALLHLYLAGPPDPGPKPCDHRASAPSQAGHRLPLAAGAHRRARRRVPDR